MNFRKYNVLYNFVWFQTVWFTAVLGGDNWITALAVLIILHFLLVDDVKTEIQFVFTGAALGITMDNILTYYGVYLFNPERAFLDFPLWMMALWLGFCGTIRHSLKYLTTMPYVLIASTLIFAPLSYIAASKLGAVELPLGDVYTALITGLSWMAITALLLYLNDFFSKQNDSEDESDDNLLKTQEASH